MTGASNLLRTLIIYSVVLPLALIIGYAMATPMDRMTWGLLAVVLSLICMPLALKFHRPALFLFWNTTTVVFFLPGRPQVWILTAGIGFLIVVLQKTLVREMRFLKAPSLLMPLAALAVVIFITAKFRGGFGLASFGDSVGGGRRYFTMFAAMAGFIAMISAQVPLNRALFYTGLFFLGNLLNAIGALVNYVTPSFYWIFLLFPVDSLPGQGGGAVGRSYGLSLAAMGIFIFQLARYGFKDLVFGGRFWRLAIFVAAALITMMGGYRSFFIVLAFTAFFVAYYEKLFTSKYMGIFLIVGILGAILLVPLSTKLPLPIQRTLSVVPLVEVSPQAEQDAQTSTEWRLKMWESLLPEVPKYFWLGKGLAIDVREFSLTRDLTAGDVTRAFEGSKMAGDFHNGPLTVQINFGIWGTLAWIWFLWASGRAMYLNFAYGEESLKKINALLLSYFLARVINYWLVFGSFHTDVPTFLGLIGLAVALNGGIKKPVRLMSYVAPAKPAPKRQVSSAY